MPKDHFAWLLIFKHALAGINDRISAKMSFTNKEQRSERRKNSLAALFFCSKSVPGVFL